MAAKSRPSSKQTKRGSSRSDKTGERFPLLRTAEEAKIAELFLKSRKQDGPLTPLQRRMQSSGG